MVLDRGQVKYDNAFDIIIQYISIGQVGLVAGNIMLVTDRFVGLLYEAKA